MAITYVNGDISADTASVSSVTGLNWVTHTASDLAVVGWALLNTATPTLDAALTSSSNVVDTNVRGIVGTKATTGSESGAFSLTCDAPSANRMAAALAIYRGCTLGQIVSLGEASGTAQTSHTSPTITPANGASGFVLVFVERVGSTVAPAGTPSGFTKRQEFSTGGTGGTSAVIYDDLSGTHGTSAWTPANVVSLTASTSAIVFLVELIPTASAFTGSLGTSGSGALTFAATPAISAPVALSGSGQLSSSAVVATSGTVALSGSGQVAGAGAPAAAGSLGLSGVGTATDTGSPSASGPAALAGSGTLTETGSPAFARPAAFSGAGALAPAGQPMLPGNLSLSGGGTLGPVGIPAAAGSLDLSGLGVLLSDGTPALMQDLVLAGAGLLGLDGTVVPSGPVVVGHLVASVSQSLTAADRYSVLTASTEPTSRLEASDGV